MIKFKIGLVVLAFSLFAFTAHKFYLSLTKIEYKKESKTVQITMRIFIDDLQETINTTYNKNIELALADEPKEIDSLFQNYISDNFLISINSNSKKYLYLGKEYENDVVYLYLEINNVENIDAIQIKNSMLVKNFPDQKNIIKLNINDKKKTFILSREKDKDLLKF